MKTKLLVKKTSLLIPAILFIALVVVGYIACVNSSKVNSLEAKINRMEDEYRKMDDLTLDGLYKTMDHLEGAIEVYDENVDIYTDNFNIQEDINEDLDYRINRIENYLR